MPAALQEELPSYSYCQRTTTYSSLSTNSRYDLYDLVPAIFSSARAETTHQIVVEAGTAEALEGMLEHLEQTDRKEKELVDRALTALEPDGWRGVDHGLRDEVRETLVHNSMCPATASCRRSKTSDTCGNVAFGICMPFPAFFTAAVGAAFEVVGTRASRLTSSGSWDLVVLRVHFCLLR